MLSKRTGRWLTLAEIYKTEDHSSIRKATITIVDCFRKTDHLQILVCNLDAFGRVGTSR